MHGEAVSVKARPGREKTKMAVPPRVLTRRGSVSTLRIRFLPLVVFSVLSCTFSEHYRKKSVDQRPPKSKAEFRTPIVDLLCVKELRKGKERQNACRKNPDRVCRKGQLNTRCSGWRKKKTGLLRRHPFERKSLSIKAKGRQSRSTGFARDLVGSSWAQSQAVGRSIYIYIYIYIANDESSSQHVTVGLAEARPNKKKESDVNFYLCSKQLESGNVDNCIIWSQPSFLKINFRSGHLSFLFFFFLLFLFERARKPLKLKKKKKK